MVNAKGVSWLIVCPCCGKKIVCKAAGIRGKSRHLATARELGTDCTVLRDLVVQEVARLLTDGRIPLDMSLEALQMVIAEVEDRLTDSTLSWVEDIRIPWHGGDRGLSGRN